MLLRTEADFNDISPELRKKLEERVKGFGKTVRYKFDISSENPDPQKHDGKVIWPNQYILDPATFYIQDTLEKREGKSKSKRIGLILETDYENGHLKIKKYDKIKVDGKYKGVFTLQLEEIPEHFEYALYLEMHPKLTGGDFADKSKRQMISRIDEKAAATEARKVRSDRKKALDAVEGMSDKQLIDFADAMMWDSSQDPNVLRNLAEELAETDPVYFNDKVEGKTVEYQAAVKQALNKQVIMFDPADRSFSYASNKQKIVILPPISGKNEVEQFAEWIQVGGSKEKAVYEQIKTLIK